MKTKDNTIHVNQTEYQTTVTVATLITIIGGLISSSGLLMFIVGMALVGTKSGLNLSGMEAFIGYLSVFFISSGFFIGGLFTVVTAQITLATIATADNTRELLKLAKSPIYQKKRY